MPSRPDSSAVIIGSGPGIGAHTAAMFAKKRFNKVALLARNIQQLKKDAALVAGSLPDQISIKVYSVDVSDSAALAKTLKQINSDLGTPEFVFFNAALVRPSTLLETPDDDILQDIKISTIALHQVARWAVPQLSSVANLHPLAKPTLMVTSSHLPEMPHPAIFSLSLAKAAQKNLTRSLRDRFGADGIHVCLLTVVGRVEDSDPVLNPRSIASKAWELYSQEKENWSEEIRVGMP